MDHRSEQDINIRRFTEAFHVESSGYQKSVLERMKEHGIPGLGLVLVRDNEIVHKNFFGFGSFSPRVEVQENTVFQAASLSKTITAIGVLLLHQESKFDVRDNIQEYISLKIPVRPCGDKAWISDLSIASLLNHTSGIIGRGNTYPLDVCAGFNEDGGGFEGYFTGRQERLPNLDQIIRGENYPEFVNSPPIEITVKPGPFHYSGAGYVLLMRLIEEVTGQNFNVWIQDNVLRPLKMDLSFFAAGNLEPKTELSCGYLSDHVPVEGGHYDYPELSAAGLYSTAADLGRLVCFLNGPSGTNVLNLENLRMLRKKQMGIFLGFSKRLGEFFWHSGRNKGFSSVMLSYPSLKAGIVLMSNKDGADGKFDFFTQEAVEAFERFLVGS